MADKYRVMLLFGPPGAGKGTQGKILGQIPGVRHMATGEMFRSLDPESELGQRVRGYSSRGELVPDDVTLELWQDYMAKLIERGGYTPEKDLLVLDGIPRSPAQAAMLDDLVEVLAVVHLHPPDLEAMVQRMKQRALKEGRQDDADENVIRRRFQVYADQTAQVLRHYSNGLVKDVAADGTPIEVLNRVLDVISPMYADGFGNPLG